MGALLTKQSTGIEIFEKAGHRNPEVLKYEGLHNATFTASLYCDKHFFSTITIHVCHLKFYALVGLPEQSTIKLLWLCLSSIEGKSNVRLRVAS